MALKSGIKATIAALSVSCAVHATNPEDGVPQFAIIDWFPFGWAEDGQDKGMFVEMVALYRQYLSADLDAVIAPVPRVIRGMEEGEFDFTITYRDPGMLDVKYVADIGCLDSYIVSYSDNPIKSLEGLNGLRVAFPGGGYFDKRFRPNLDLDGVQVAQTFVMFRMALRRRLDAFIINDAVWQGYKNDLYPGFKVPAERWADFAEPVAIETLPVAVSISPKSPHTAIGHRITELSHSDTFMADLQKLYDRYKLPNAMACLARAGE
ncbi:MAG: hypothetical protein HWE25_01050 [Alphaproteobacteria bacterium]|nr:hypothetical protein [Alphaproteobacteria bacterium]